MIDLPLPPPIACVRTQDVPSTTFEAELIVSGDPAQLEAWLTPVRQRNIWSIDEDVSSTTFRSVRLIADGNVPYREIGSVIYEAQRRHLAVSYRITPPLCEGEDE